MILAAEIQRFLEPGTSAQFELANHSYDCRILDVNLHSKTVELVLDRVEKLPEDIIGSEVQMEVRGDWYSLKIPARVETVVERSFGVVVLLHIGERIIVSKKRRFARYPVLIKTKVNTEGNNVQGDCVVIDISTNGLGLICEGFSKAPQKLSVPLDDGTVKANVRAIRRIGWMYKIGAQAESGQNALEAIVEKAKQTLKKRGLDL